MLDQSLARELMKIASWRICWTNLDQNCSSEDFEPTWRWLGDSVLVLSWVCVLVLA